MAGYVAAYQREGFRQSLGDPTGWTLNETDQQFGALVYRRGDEVAVVPNVPYNQPVAWRIKEARWQAERQRERVATLKADPFPKPWASHDIKSAEESAARMDALADVMEQTGKHHTINPQTGEFEPTW